MKIYKNRQIVEIPDAEKEKYIFPVADNKEAQIEVLKQKLLDTDYQAIKYAEGWLTEEEYALIKAQRQEWRNQINALENSE